MKWKLIKLGEICDIVTGGTPDTSINEYWDNGDIPWLPSGTCQNCIIKSANTFITEEGLANSSAKIMPINTVVIALTGATTGKVGILNIEACANQSVTGILPNDALYYKYIFYYLMFSRNRILEDSYGGAQKHISQGYVKNFKIPQPPMDIQIAISNNLDKVTNLIEVCRNILVKLDLVVKSRFVEMFGDLRLNPKGWQVQNFDELSEIITDGEHATPRRTTHGIYLLSARNVLNHAIQLEDVDFIDQDEYDRISKRIVPREGDVLVSCSGSVGRCCHVPAGLKFQMVRSAALIRFKEEISPIFAEYMITSDYVQKQIEAAKTASSQANLFQGKIAKLRGFVPPLELQNQFAAFVEQTDKSKFIAINIKKIIRRVRFNDQF
jgi:restriction endonuclease S subunit